MHTYIHMHAMNLCKFNVINVSDIKKINILTNNHKVEFIIWYGTYLLQAVGENSPLFTAMPYSSKRKFMFVLAFFSPPSSAKTKRLPPSSTWRRKMENWPSVNLCLGQAKTTTPAWPKFSLVRSSRLLKEADYHMAWSINQLPSKSQ